MAGVKRKKMPVRAKVTLKPLTYGVRVEEQEECGRISFLPVLFTSY
jgi:hypothetical protein